MVIVMLGMCCCSSVIGPSPAVTEIVHGQCLRSTRWDQFKHSRCWVPNNWQQWQFSHFSSWQFRSINPLRGLPEIHQMFLSLRFSRNPQFPKMQFMDRNVLTTCHFLLFLPHYLSYDDDGTNVWNILEGRQKKCSIPITCLRSTWQPASSLRAATQSCHLMTQAIKTKQNWQHCWKSWNPAAKNRVYATSRS